MRNLGGLRTSRSGVRGKGASAVEVGTPNALEKLAPGREAAIGATLYEHPTPGAVWAYRQAGLNWLWLDTEHMPNDDATVRGVAEAALHFEIPLLVRVRDVRAAPLSRMLDLVHRASSSPAWSRRRRRSSRFARATIRRTAAGASACSRASAPTRSARRLTRWRPSGAARS